MMSIHSLRTFIILGILVSPSLGKLYTDFSQLTKTTYDYVVVGGMKPLLVNSSVADGMHISSWYCRKRSSSAPL